MGYNPYTSDDEKKLVSYLAIYNRDGKGRKGNTLYKQLTDNADGRWPWSKRHPWQSWRDYYVKNEVIINKRIKAFQKKAVEAKIEKKDTQKQSAEQEKHASSAERVTIGKRGRDSFSLQMDPNKRQKVANKVTGERHNAGPGMDEASREGTTQLKAVELGVSPTNEPESDTRCVPDEQSVDHHDRDTEERSEVDKMLENATSSTNTSEHQQAHDVLHHSPSITKTEVVTMDSLAQHSDNSFNSLFDDVSGEHASDSEKELSNKSNKVSKSFRIHQDDNFFRSSPEASVNDCSPPFNKLKSPAKRRPPTLVEGPFTSTFVKRVPKTGESDSDEPTNGSPHRPPRSIKKPRNHTRGRQHSLVQNAMIPSAEASRKNDDADVWPPNRTVRASNAPKEARDYGQTQLEQTSEVALVQELQKKPDNKPLKASTSLNQNDQKRSEQSVEGDLMIEREHDGQRGHVTEDQSHRRSLEPSPESLGHVTMGGWRHRKLRTIYDDDKHVDLRKERRQKAILRQSAGSSRSGSVAAHRSLSHSFGQSPSLPLHLSTQDQSFVASLGIQHAITMMSDNHGFTEAVVSKILQTVHSIARADEILRLMRIKAEEEATRQLTVNGEDSSDSTTSLRKSASKVHLFRISQQSDEYLSDYSPPLKTRAGRFARLAEQGRLDEARTREARRASGTISPAKLVSVSPDKSNAGNSPSRNSLSMRTQSEAEENVLSDNQEEKTEEVAEDIQELFDAHAAVASDLKKKEKGLTPRHSLRRFQQTATFLREVLTSQRT